MANPTYAGNPVDDLQLWAGIVPASAQTSTGDYATATHAAAVITMLAPPTGYANVLGGVLWSYSGGTPSGGSIKIEDGSGNVVLFEDIITAGPGSIMFPQPKRFTAATDTIVTLADGGSGIVGKVNLIGRYSDAVGGL